MSEVKWIKLSISIFDDEKIRYIEQLPEADSILTIWVKLLVLAGRKNMGGEVYFNDEIPYTEEMLSAIFHRKVNTVRLALDTFSSLRMITIAQDRTIIICNWAKYQNLEGLDKLRQQNLERVRRHRHNRYRNASCNVTDRDSNVTDRDSVTPALRDVAPQSKKQKRKEPPIVPKGTGFDDLSFDQTKQWFNELFGRERAWSDVEDELLAKLLPISRQDRDLIQWAYSLNRDSEGWALVDGMRTSKPKHSLIVLLREFGSEVDKWRSVRKQADLSPKISAKSEKIDDPWPTGTKEMVYELYGEDVTFPARFSELPISIQREALDRLKQLKEKVA